MWHLSKGKIFATDYTNASRTMLFNIHTLTWDDELLRLFGVPRVMLPEVYPSGHDYGVTAKSLLGESVPVLSVAGDQQAALFGHLCVESGSLKKHLRHGLLRFGKHGGQARKVGSRTDNDACRGQGRKAAVCVGRQRVCRRRGCQMAARRAENDKKCGGNGSVRPTRPRQRAGFTSCPAFVGLGAPYWDSDARGTVVGLTRGTTKEHFVRACLESIAYEVCDIIDAMGKGHRKKSRACGCGRRSERKRFSHAISVRPARQKNLPPLCDGKPPRLARRILRDLPAACGATFRTYAAAQTAAGCSSRICKTKKEARCLRAGETQ